MFVLRKLFILFVNWTSLADFSVIPSVYQQIHFPPNCYLLQDAVMGTQMWSTYLSYLIRQTYFFYANFSVRFFIGRVRLLYLRGDP